MTPRAIRTALTATWWLVMPPFALLVVRLTYERACAAPYELLPAVTSVPVLAWLLAGIYVAAHTLLVAAYVATAIHADTLAPSPVAARTLWGRQSWMLAATVLIFALEYWPVPLLRLLGRQIGCPS